MQKQQSINQSLQHSRYTKKSTTEYLRRNSQKWIIELASYWVMYKEIRNAEWTPQNNVHQSV